MHEICKRKKKTTSLAMYFLHRENGDFSILMKDIHQPCILQQDILIYHLKASKLLLTEQHTTEDFCGMLNQVCLISSVISPILWILSLAVGFEHIREHPIWSFGCWKGFLVSKSSPFPIVVLIQSNSIHPLAFSSYVYGGVTFIHIIHSVHSWKLKL